MLWNQCTYEWYNNSTQYYFDLEFHIYIIPTKGLRSTTFNNKISMVFYTYIKETINNNLSHQSFQFFLSSWNLNKMIFKCSLVHYGMKMLMIMIFLG
jgi:hypothetical protein